MLRLVGMRMIDQFPASIAGALKGLTNLDLSCTDLTRFPTALSQIITLRSLDLSYNNNLMLQYRDSHSLAAFPHLQRLRLETEEIAGMSSVLMDILRALQTMRPQLLMVLSVDLIVKK
jgi:hypothetical protein